MSTGVIYIATGKRFIEEASNSAASLKSFMPGMHITLFSDEDVGRPCFDNVVRITAPRNGFFDKILNMSCSPYVNTLFLDADTYLCRDISEIFELLDRFDIAASHAAYRTTYHIDEIPDCFPEFSSGAVLFRQSPRMKQLFSTWLALYERDLKRDLQWVHPLQDTLFNGDLPDQPTFREAIYQSDLRVATLPPEYHCVFTSPGFVQNPVKILHGRHPNLSKIQKALNAKENVRRIHVMRMGFLKVYHRPEPSRRIFDQARWALHHLGIRKTILAAARRLFFPRSSHIRHGRKKHDPSVRT